jgi:hypothetical protein
VLLIHKLNSNSNHYKVSNILIVISSNRLQHNLISLLNSTDSTISAIPTTIQSWTYTNPGNLTTASSIQKSDNCRPGDTLVGNICYPAVNNSTSTSNCNFVNDTKNSLCQIQQSTYQNNTGNKTNLMKNSILSAADFATLDSMARAIDSPLVKEYRLWAADPAIQKLIV